MGGHALRERWRMPAMMVLVAAAQALTITCHHGLHTGVVFTHAFYLPILLAIHWWGSRGLVVSGVLAATLLGSRLATGDAEGLVEDLLRATMFLGVGVVVARFAHVARRRTAEARLLQLEVVTTAERTQRQVGCELHDDICQRLTGLGLLSEVLAQRLDPLDETAARQAGTLVAGLRDAAGQARRVAGGLMPVELDHGDMAAAFAELAASVAQAYRCECRATVAPRFAGFDPEAAVQLYRIAQEAAVNAARHGGARRITIDLAAPGSAAILRVEDDGRGLPKQRARGRGLGLATMSYRAGLLGGRLLFEDRQGGGTSLTCRLENCRGFA